MPSSARRRLLAWGLLALLAPSRQVSASLFGEENLTLGAILAEAIQHTLHLKDTVAFIRETAAHASDTARFTEEAIQVARGVRTLVHHPTEFSAYLTRSWSRALPRLTEGGRGREMTPEEVAAWLGRTESSGYDPGAFAQAFDDLGHPRLDAFEVVAHAIDLWGVNDPHDEAIEVLHELHRESADNLDTVNRGLSGEGMTAREAAVHGARGQALTAEAQIRTAATVERLARTAELQSMRALAKEARGARQDLGQAQDAARPHVQGWRLDPLRPGGRRSKQR